MQLNLDKIEGKIEHLSCGINHYAFSDSGNNLHCFGKVFDNKAAVDTGRETLMSKITGSG